MDAVLFIVFPYVAVILAIGVGLHRYLSGRYTYSSLSSQLLENRKLFWGSVPWHYGITLVLLAHLLTWLFPGPAAAILGNGTRLFVFEAVGLALSFFAALGIIFLIIRRLPTHSRARSVTSGMDWVLLFFLLVQVFTGMGVALFDRWGSLWYLSTAVPWLWSLLLLHPDSSTVVALPALIQFHFVWGFAIILLFPFSRLVHIFTIPIEYLWRPYQIVIWYREPRREGRPIGAAGPPQQPPQYGAHITPPVIDGGLSSSGGAAGARAGVLERMFTSLLGFTRPLGFLPLNSLLLSPFRVGRLYFANSQNHELPHVPGEPIHPVQSDEYLHQAGHQGLPEDMLRRSLLTKIAVAAGAVAAAIIVVPSVAFLLGLRKTPTIWRAVGKTSDFQVGQTVEVSFSDATSLPWAGVTAKTAAWLRRVAEDQFLAFSINCTHLGCPVRWLPDADLFMCPCHGGVFYSDGTVASGPPPKPLTTYPVRINNGIVEIQAGPLPITTTTL
jgi:nitrate reductase gamma subunit